MKGYSFILLIIYCVGSNRSIAFNVNETLVSPYRAVAEDSDNFAIPYDNLNGFIEFGQSQMDKYKR